MMITRRCLSLVVPCAFALALVLVVTCVEVDPASIGPKLGSVFFIEPFYSAASPEMRGGVIFATWLIVAAVIFKSRKQCRGFRMVMLMLLPTAAVCAFNGLFEVSAMTPAVGPTAVVALIGAVLYELAIFCTLGRMSLATITFAVCGAYGIFTGLGLWGTGIAALAMTVAQLTWSGVEMNLFRLTSALRDRRFEYR